MSALDLLTGVDASNLFVASASQTSSIESLSNTALSSGIDAYTSGDYEKAVKEFKRSIAIGRTVGSSYTVDAAHYMANAHKQLGQYDKAVEDYRLATELDGGREDSYVYLGNLLYAQERYAEAQDAYLRAVEINPSGESCFSLGQAYMQNSNYAQAEDMFEKVVRLDEDSANGYYGLGQLYARQERYDEAVIYFDKAIARDDEFYDAYAEKGYTLADAGDIEGANEVLAFLQKNDEDRAGTLEDYIYQAQAPRIEFAYATTNFLYTMPSRSKVVALDSYLANASTHKTFYMEFQFSKEMDTESVLNRYNWSISRSESSDSGSQYNFGLPVPETEVRLTPYPDIVTYDPKSYTARVYFTITQNAAADATIDPSHISFKFSGKDAFGKKMDAEGDQFSGFSGTY